MQETKQIGKILPRKQCVYSHNKLLRRENFSSTFMCLALNRHLASLRQTSAWLKSFCFLPHYLTGPSKSLVESLYQVPRQNSHHIPCVLFKCLAGDGDRNTQINDFITINKCIIHAQERFRR